MLQTNFRFYEDACLHRLPCPSKIWYRNALWHIFRKMNPNPAPGSRHVLDDTSLGKYLVDKIPELKLPVVSTKIGYGQSNPTFFIDDAA